MSRCLLFGRGVLFDIRRFLLVVVIELVVCGCLLYGVYSRCLVLGVRCVLFVAGCRAFFLGSYFLFAGRCCVFVACCLLLGVCCLL